MKSAFVDYGKEPCQLVNGVASQIGFEREDSANRASGRATFRSAKVHLIRRSSRQDGLAQFGSSKRRLHLDPHQNTIIRKHPLPCRGVGEHGRSQRPVENDHILLCRLSNFAVNIDDRAGSAGRIRRQPWREDRIYEKFAKTSTKALMRDNLLCLCSGYQMACIRPKPVSYVSIHRGDPMVTGVVWFSRRAATDPSLSLAIYFNRQPNRP